MKFLVNVGVFVSLFFLSQVHAQSQSFDELFLGLENELMQAVQERDQNVMEAMIGDAFLLTSSDSNGEFLTKDQYIEGALRPDIFVTHRFEFTEYSAQMIGSTTAIFRSQLDWESDYRGRPWNAEFLMTDIWVFEDGRWQLISRHSSYPASSLARIVEERSGN